jgi:hypothetical protein
MVNHGARQAAAQLVRLFKDAAITNEQFENDWPYVKEDRALLAIRSWLWRFYDDFKTHTLSGDLALSAEGRALFDRCELFLRSNLEYEWPVANFYGGDGIGLLPLIHSFGLFLPFHFWLKIHYSRIQKALVRSGDVAVWPFIRRSDYETMRCQQA